jgi:hypothetical protein
MDRFPHVSEGKRQILQIACWEHPIGSADASGPSPSINSRARLKDDSYSNKSIEEEERVLVELLAKDSVLFILLTSFLDETQAYISQLYYKKGHWTAFAYQRVAQALADAISSQLKNLERHSFRWQS